MKDMEKSVDKRSKGCPITLSSTDRVDDEPLIPGLLDELALICLAKISHGFLGVLECVCRRWRHVIRSEEYASCKARMGCCGDWLFLLTGKEGLESQWNAYDPEADRWHPMPQMPRLIHYGFSVVTVRNRLLVIGGACSDRGTGKDTSVTNRVLCFDPFRQKWSEVASMSTPRVYFACAAICGKVYAAGGRCLLGLDINALGQPLGVLSSAEMYDPLEDRWDDLPSMPSKRFCCTGLSYNSKFYITNDYRYHNRAVEIFSPLDRQWCTRQDELQSRKIIHRVFHAINDRLYRVRDDRQVLTLNSETEDWLYVGPVPPVTLTEYPQSQSYDYTVCGFRNNLYLLGGRAIYVVEGILRRVQLRTMRFCDPSTTPLQWREARPIPASFDYIIASASLEGSQH